MVTWFMRGYSGAERLFTILDTESTIQDAPDAQALEQVNGRVRFEHVSFAYGTGTEVLHDITIDAQARTSNCASWPNRKWEKHHSEPSAALL